MGRKKGQNQAPQVRRTHGAHSDARRREDHLCLDKASLVITGRIHVWTCGRHPLGPRPRPNSNTRSRPRSIRGRRFSISPRMAPSSWRGGEPPLSYRIPPLWLTTALLVYVVQQDPRPRRPEGTLSVSGPCDS
jgi:hypothetical protein